MKLFKQHTQSLSGKLTLLFVGMTILLVLLSAIFIGSAFKKNFHTTVRPHLDKYLEYLLEELGNPPDINQAYKIAKEIPGFQNMERTDDISDNNIHVKVLLGKDLVLYDNYLTQQTILSIKSMRSKNHF